MQISPDTKIMARINKAVNSRGIAPYNIYFEKTGTDAVCFEFHNPDLKILLEGMKNLNFLGAVTVAFEYDPEFFDLMDEIDPVCHKTGLIGFVTQRNGRYKGYAQGGWGLKNALEEYTSLENKKIVFFGAGHMTRGLLAQIESDEKIPEIEIYNRSIKNAENVAKQFPLVKKVGSIRDFEKSAGDILINTSTIGAPWNKGSGYNFDDDTVSNFSFVADVNFVPLKTPLIVTGEKLGKTVIPGWQTFKYGTVKCFETILDIKVDTKVLGDVLVKDFASNWS